MKESAHNAIITSSGSVVKTTEVTASQTGAGGDLYFRFSAVDDLSQLTSEARSLLVKTPNRELAGQALRLLQDIEGALQGLGSTGYDLRNLPPLRAVAPEDNSIVFEWASPKFRVGFSVESDPSHSGWYVVSTQDLGGTEASGQLAGIEPKDLASLLHFVAVNS